MCPHMNSVNQECLYVLKLINSESATKFQFYLVNVKSMWEIFSNFVALSENLDFKS